MARRGTLATPQIHQSKPLLPRLRVAHSATDANRRVFRGSPCPHGGGGNVNIKKIQDSFEACFNVFRIFFKSAMLAQMN